MGTEAKLGLNPMLGSILLCLFSKSPRSGTTNLYANCCKLRHVQFPVRLCFAMTINKSQGQSVNHVGIDARSAVFTHAQFYVAISGVTSVHNIKIIWDNQHPNPVTKNIVYPEVLLD